MALVVLFISVIVLVSFPTLRCAILNFPFTVYYFFRDGFYKYVRKELNIYPTGELVGYVGLFGKGKTLSAVHRVVSAYKRYDGLPVWCPRRKKMVTQRVKIISNVTLKDIPFEYFTSLQQIVEEAENKDVYDNEHDTLTITLVLGDEFSVQMNSRNFKTNIDPLFLNTILTCRHHYISLYYTAQRFHHVDALLRQVTSEVIECDKLWRFQRLAKFDAWDLENATNSNLVQPLAQTCWFVRNKDFEAYDTFAVVENLEHSRKAGDMINEKEIMELRQTSGDMERVSKPSKSWTRRQRKVNVK